MGLRTKEREIKKERETLMRNRWIYDILGGNELGKRCRSALPWSDTVMSMLTFVLSPGTDFGYLGTRVTVTRVKLPYPAPRYNYHFQPELCAWFTNTAVSILEKQFQTTWTRRQGSREAAEIKLNDYWHV